VDCIDIDLSQVLHEAPQLPLLNADDDLQLSWPYNMCSKIMSYTDIPFFSPFITEVFFHLSYSCRYTNCNNIKPSQKWYSRIY